MGSARHPRQICGDPDRGFYSSMCRRSTLPRRGRPVAGTEAGDCRYGDRVVMEETLAGRAGRAVPATRPAAPVAGPRQLRGSHRWPRRWHARRNAPARARPLSAAIEHLKPADWSGSAPSWMPSRRCWSLGSSPAAVSLAATNPPRTSHAFRRRFDRYQGRCCPRGSTPTNHMNLAYYVLLFRLRNRRDLRRVRPRRRLSANTNSAPSRPNPQPVRAGTAGERQRRTHRLANLAADARPCTLRTK